MGKRKCACNCGRFEHGENMVISRNGMQAWIDDEHRLNWALKNSRSLAQKAKAERETKQKRKDKVRRKELKTRSEWYNTLQALVNQYVAKVRDKNKPCCTCGTAKPGTKYDAGHFIPRKEADPRRFELTNIHKQCSVICNQHGSGKRAEYRDFIREKYGQEHLDWLECEVNHKPLKEQFPHWSDIEVEIKRYRKLLRESGITPIR